MPVRHADPECDAAACAAIYAPHVIDSAVSFEEVAPGADEFAAMIAQTSERYPWVVLEARGSVVGYSYAKAHRERAAYGFEHVGTHRAIGWKAGAWRDVAWWQLQLLPPADDGAPPPEPRAPQRP